MVVGNPIIVQFDRYMGMYLSTLPYSCLQVGSTEPVLHSDPAVLDLFYGLASEYKIPLYLNPLDRNNVTTLEKTFRSLLGTYNNQNVIIFMPKDYLIQNFEHRILSFIEKPINRLLRIVNERPPGLPRGKSCAT